MATTSKSSRSYSNDLLSIPGITFDVTVADPVLRIRSYLETYRNSSDKGAVSAVLCPFYVYFLYMKL